MGVERSDYVVIGANIGYDKFDEDAWEDYEVYDGQHEAGKLTYIIDGMSGEYFVVGIVVTADVDGYDHGFGLVEIDTRRDFEEEKRKVKEHVREAFGIDIEPKIIVMTHFH